MTVCSARTSLIALVAAFFVGFGLMFAPAVNAHDQLIGSNPEDGAELAQQPPWIELEFSGEVQELGSEIQVMHEGQDVYAGETAFDGTTVMGALPDDLGPGDYTIVWRVVSSDGHPISGEVNFAITDDGGAGGEVEGTEGAADEGTEGASEGAADEGVADESAAADEGSAATEGGAASEDAAATEGGEGSEGGAALGAATVDQQPTQGEERGSLESGEAQAASAGLSSPMIVLLGVGGLAVIVIVVALLMRKNRGLPGTEDGGTRNR